jgi:hypothetical protein
MSMPTEPIPSRALLAHRAELYRIEPSTELDVRFNQSLQGWRTEWAQPGKRRRLSWMLGAAAALVLMAGGGWLVMHASARHGEAALPNSGYVRLAPADAAVLRLRGSLGAPLPDAAGHGFPARRSHYWLDVGITDDGLLYVERVTPIDEDPGLFVP